ncbi:hypothetical protein CAP31_04055 [Sulfuriferula sp. AH1]|uniref:hypothetical protein n=1 Tax=Sulfuriferula sp. AH1 TaxID=1985873 RepID=UPI000B3B7963|nr:hypothetical protein [Sulfuriferula sp. AH1]ARU30933.1 hypothetical protein CAP31_04055 [Sulfuriferula sp. AH1]
MKLRNSLLLATALFTALPLAYADGASCSYVNGGIGEGDQAMMRRIAKEFPLQMEFSEGKPGAFVADIPVTITDEHNKVVLNLSNVGPMLYVRLPKGKYTIKAVSNGVTQSSKVTLDGKHSKHVILHWDRPLSPDEAAREKGE